MNYAVYNRSNGPVYIKEVDHFINSKIKRRPPKPEPPKGLGPRDRRASDDHEPWHNFTTTSMLVAQWIDVCPYGDNECSEVIKYFLMTSLLMLFLRVTHFKL